MAFQILETNILQSALKAAAQVTAALVTVGDEDAVADPTGTLNELTDELFEKLQAAADRDNEKLRDEEKTSGSNNRNSGGRKGGTRRGGGSVEDDGSMEMTWGAFKGLSIAEIYDLSKDEADEYGYGDGKKSGRDYINWLSKNQDNDYAASRAKAFIAAKRNAA